MNLWAAPIGIGILVTALWLRPSSVPEAPPKPQAHMMVAQDAPKEIRLKKRGNGHFYIHGMVDGQIVEFLVDSGASGVVLTVKDAERVGLPVYRGSFTVIGTGASGAVRGQVSPLESVEIEGRTVTGLEAMVADGLQISLLGQDFLKHMSVSMSGDTMVLR